MQKISIKKTMAHWQTVLPVLRVPTPGRDKKSTTTTEEHSACPVLESVCSFALKSMSYLLQKKYVIRCSGRALMIHDDFYC